MNIDDMLRKAHERATAPAPTAGPMQPGPAYWRGNCVLMLRRDTRSPSFWWIQVGRSLDDPNEDAYRVRAADTELIPITWERVQLLHTAEWYADV